MRHRPDPEAPAPGGPTAGAGGPEPRREQAAEAGGAEARPEQAAEPLGCEAALALVDAWGDGDLAPADRTLLERHAVSCPGCALELEAARRLAEDLRRLPALACPPRVTRAVLARAEAEARAADAWGAEAEARGLREPAARPPGWAGPPGRDLGPAPAPRPARGSGLRRRLGRRAAASLVALAGRAATPGRDLAPRSRRTGPRPLWLRPALAAALVVALAAGGTLFLRRPTPPPPSPEELARAEVEIKLAFAYLGRVGRDAGLRVRDEVVANVVVPTRRAVAMAGAPQTPR